MTMRVGIVGAGTMGEVHAAAWRNVGAELAGCTSIRRAQSEDLAQRYGMIPYADCQELINDVDIVDICTPTEQHKPMVFEAAAAKKHVFCEKPIALTVQDAQAMIDACAAAGVRFFIGMVVRFFPQYRLAKGLVAQGSIGQLSVLRLKRMAYLPIKPVDNWYTDETRSGGMVLDLMIHDFDYARWLAGEVDRVFARRGQAVSSPAQYIQTIIRFKSGALALVEGGWAYPQGVFRTALDVSGTDGLIEWNSDQPLPVQTYLPPTEGLAKSVGLPVAELSEDPYTSEIRHAYEAIRTNAHFEVTADDALQALRIALAARDSLSTGRVVSLGPGTLASDGTSRDPGLAGF
jgi:myo-inositol 2-dehydrogenase/D-chiro-inositol 1-dehydrogenase